MINSWSKWLWHVKWCHDTIELMQIILLAILVGVVVAMAVLTKRSDTQWRQSMQQLSTLVKQTQEQAQELERKMKEYHP